MVKSDVEENMVHRGLGYMMRTLIRDLDIEYYEPEMKEHVWNIVLKLVDKAKELNLQWKYVDVVMQIKDERLNQWRENSELS